MGGIYIGTSGWSYKGWDKYFCPQKLPKTRQLAFYTTQQHARNGRPAFVYFNNDLNVRAPANSKLLMEMVGKSAVQPAQPAAPLTELLRAA